MLKTLVENVTGIHESIESKLEDKPLFFILYKRYVASYVATFAFSSAAYHFTDLNSSLTVKP